jgi:hypothetical protein
MKRLAIESEKMRKQQSDLMMMMQ